MLQHCVILGDEALCICSLVHVVLRECRNMAMFHSLSGELSAYLENVPHLELKEVKLDNFLKPFLEHI